jgi:hypothetical protein
MKLQLLLVIHALRSEARLAAMTISSTSVACSVVVEGDTFVAVIGIHHRPSRRGGGHAVVGVRRRAT